MIATIPVGPGPFGVAVSPDGSKVYVANEGSSTVSMIATASNTVTATIPVGSLSRGVAVSPDDTKVYVTHPGIIKACFYEPMVNRTYADLARYYGTAIVPARPYKPRDKAKVEVGVQVIGRWILARLRHRRFFSLAELNAAIRALLDEINNRPMRGWDISRQALFAELDQPALVSLPPFPDAAPSGAGSVIPKPSRRCHAPDPDRGVGQLPSQH